MPEKISEKIEKQIHIAAPISRVWRALTDPQQFGEWFKVKFEGPFIAGEPIIGQITHPGYEHVRMEFVVGEIIPETYFSYRWHPFAVKPDIDYTQEEKTLVEFTLEESDGGTLLKVTESGFEKVPEYRRAEALSKNTGGWAQQMKNIEAYVNQAA